MGLVPNMPSSYSIRKWAFLLFLPLLVSAWAEEETQAPVQIKLVSELATIVPGEPFTVGISLQHAPHHHSYYKFPGIVGVPTNITWELPEGFVAAPLQWPTPEQVDMRGHGAYGYHEDTVILAEITPPKTLSQTDSVRLVGKVGYMCCSQERCTPGFEDLEMNLAVGKTSIPDETWHTRIGKTRAALPKALEGWHASVTEQEMSFTLSLRPPADFDPDKRPKPASLYFFSWNGWTASNEPHECAWKEDQYVFTMPKHPFPDEGETRFQGVIRSETGWPGVSQGQGIWIDVALPSN